MRKRIQQMFFWLLLMLGIGQLPSVVGRGFLFLALLVFPNAGVQCFVEEMLSNCSKRWFWFVLLFLYFRFIPLEEIELAGKCMGRFLYGIGEWLCYISGK